MFFTCIFGHCYIHSLSISTRNFHLSTHKQLWCFGQVAKERAVESLLLPGGKFVLNVLGQGKVAPITKQLLKPFKPGEPRYGELNTKESKNGGRILLDAVKSQFISWFYLSSWKYYMNIFLEPMYLSVFV